MCCFSKFIPANEGTELRNKSFNGETALWLQRELKNIQHLWKVLRLSHQCFACKTYMKKVLDLEIYQVHIDRALGCGFSPRQNVIQSSQLSTLFRLTFICAHKS